MPSYPESLSVTCFSVRAGADPSVMPRVLEQFAKRGLVPRRWHSVSSKGELHIDVQVEGLEPALVAHIGRCLGQIVGVDEVLTYALEGTCGVGHAPEAEHARGAARRLPMARVGTSVEALLLDGAAPA